MKDTIKFLQPARIRRGARAVSRDYSGYRTRARARRAHKALRRDLASGRKLTLNGSENPNRRNFVRKSVSAPSRHKCLTGWHIL